MLPDTVYKSLPLLMFFFVLHFVLKRIFCFCSQSDMRCVVVLVTQAALIQGLLINMVISVKVALEILLMSLSVNGLGLLCDVHTTYSSPAWVSKQDTCIYYPCKNGSSHHIQHMIQLVPRTVSFTCLYTRECVTQNGEIPVQGSIQCFVQSSWSPRQKWSCLSYAYLPRG